MSLKKSLLGFTFLFTMIMSAKAQVKVAFEVSFKEPQAHYAEIEMNISGIQDKNYIDVKMPVWTPGSYLVREFSKSVEDFGAAVANKDVKSEKISKNTWRVYHNKSNTVKINYRVYAFEISVRTAFIDASHAFLSSASIFMYPDKHLNASSTVKINLWGNWNKVSTGLEPVAGQQNTFYAKDFDILFDSPIEVGTQDVFEFMASGVRHEVAMVGGGNYDKEKLKVDMAKIVEEGTKIFGVNPNKHYTFIVHNYSQGSGGLEHLNSTVLGASRNGYTNPARYKGFLDLVAHEYFHLWNVKRMRPVALGPFDYENENYTTNLWVSEGFTSYYENKLMLRAGHTKMEDFVNALTGAVGSVMNTPGAKVNSAAASSFDAWINGAYRPNENSRNTFVSYYAKGEVVGMLMDIEISNATKGAKSLDDVMKAMYEKNMKEGKGYTDAEFKAMVEKIAGISFTDFWNKYVTGTHPIEFEKYFGLAGIKTVDLKAGQSIPTLGVVAGRGAAGFGVASNAAPRVTVSGVIRNSAAWVGGINVNDEIISIDGEKPEANIDRMAVIANKKVGDVVKVVVQRDGLKHELDVKLTANDNVQLQSTILTDANDLQMKVRKRWMGI